MAQQIKLAPAVLIFSVGTSLNPSYSASIPLPANVLGKSAEVGPNRLDPYTSMGDPDESLASTQPNLSTATI